MSIFPCPKNWKNRPLPAKPAFLVFRHVPHEGLGTLAPALKQAGFSHRYLETYKTPGPWPALKGFHGLIIMGGPMGVYEADKYPFLKRELAYIRQAIKLQKPVLGICLGSQLIARSLGARVYPNKLKEIGWYFVEPTAAGRRDKLFAGQSRRPYVFQWHGDTFDLPKRATRLATSPRCRNQAFRLGENVYALQFHLEVDGAMVRDWLSQPGAQKEAAAVAPGQIARIRRGLPRRTGRLKRWAAEFFRRFFGSSGRRPAGLSPISAKK